MVNKTLLKMTVTGLEETKRFAKETVCYFKPGDTILLYGTLGSGKTCLTNYYVQLLGFSTGATSPSFSIINQYEGEVFINHIDFYRIQDQKELYNLGLDDIFNSNNINFIEWPQIIEDRIDWRHFRIYIDIIKSNFEQRSIYLKKYS